MRDHDPLCPTNQNDDPACWFCDLLARVRADERARAYPGREVRSQLIGAYAQLSHAEAVAAKLVEVICEQERRPDWLELTLALDEAKAERGAARAEVERLRDAYEARDIALSEVAALRKQVVFLERHVNAEVDAGREALADLRAKVSSGWVPELDHEARIAVLALIDGADHE